MPVPSITLNKPYILVSLISSPLGIQAQQNSNLVVGYVEKIYDTCDLCTVGDYVFFDRTKADVIVYGSTYYLMPDIYKIYSEPAPM